MSEEWDILTWKQKKAVKLALKSRGPSHISMNFINDVYDTENKGREAIRKLKNLGFLKPHPELGNTYQLLAKHIPKQVLVEANE